ncbi:MULTISPECIES: hypothetical protein [Neisseria]|uniref:Uncharacterized protein n=1 Tax=Neisseria subflava NJ9703 TaxID=546268 RepID=A0A9W5IQ10_NEISU|nr:MULTISPECIES: hypothetical protein [Neisseria]EFC51657.1 hypothetical protein NEISUBOT_04912 [Neisseria subflava NJ9703]MBF1277412.1 hypothetical protein [Neisseria sp.]MBF1281113.1 hypothetical protein [Neisseria sp.]
MKQWVIEIIHNVDILCNVAFWISAMALFALSLNGDESAKEIAGFWLKVFLVSLFGVMVIPSKEVLEAML